MDAHMVPRSSDRNYTGGPTKTFVYMVTLVIFLVAFALTLSSLILPNWISYHSERPYIHTTYGLTTRCTTTATTKGASNGNANNHAYTLSCTPFPDHQDCQSSSQDRYFCSMWRSVTFLMSLAVVLNAICIVAYLVILTGGKRLRESGWRVLSLLLGLGGVVQVGGMGLIAYLFNNEDRFFVGWRLDESWVYCTVAWCLSLFCAVVVAVSAFVLPAEGGYELIPDRSFYD